ncbi:MAG: HAMP domain-containing protein [Alphaproteobacteria bacterium]|nr:HAMP domain-containing protein [Alphaproteobacteria bacterium]
MLYVFYDSPWEASTRRLSLALAGEVMLVVDSLSAFPDPAQRAVLLDLARQNLGLNLRLMQGEILPRPIAEPADLLGRNVARGMAEAMTRPFRVEILRPAGQVKIAVDVGGALLHVAAPMKRVSGLGTATFLGWALASSLIFAGIAVLFLRNQIRPIRQLALAAEQLGKGRDVPDFRPRGATEVRQAATAFLDMRGRILRAIRQRTEMLAGVSHDLRTPLARMKLQLEMMPKTAAGIDGLRQDVSEMERMVEGYLAYARGADGEAARPADLARLMREVLAGFKRQGAEMPLTAPESLVLPLRAVAMRRCLTNLLDNALRHGSKVAVALGRDDAQHAVVTIDDDGPGIPLAKREDVFRPFTRLDEARSAESGGAGLGLTIARDVARGHGGELTLEDSPLGGLRAKLVLPL